MQLPIRKLLCPTDFSDPSYEGLNAAIGLAKYFSSELVVVHILSFAPRMPVEPVGMQRALMLKQIEDSSKIALRQIEDEKIPKDISAKTLLRLGIAADEIVKAASDEKVDLIVIATHGQSGWRRLIMGSVTERVVRMADRPVLTIHAPDEDD